MVTITETALHKTRVTRVCSLRRRLTLIPQPEGRYSLPAPCALERALREGLRAYDSFTPGDDVLYHTCLPDTGRAGYYNIPNFWKDGVRLNFGIGYPF